MVDILELTPSALFELLDDEFLDVAAKVLGLKKIDIVDAIISRARKELERRGLVYDHETGGIIELTPDPTARRDH